MSEWVVLIFVQTIIYFTCLFIKRKINCKQISTWHKVIGLLPTAAPLMWTTWLNGPPRYLDHFFQSEIVYHVIGILQ